LELELFDCVANCRIVSKVSFNLSELIVAGLAKELAAQFAADSLRNKMLLCERSFLSASDTPQIVPFKLHGNNLFSAYTSRSQFPLGIC
jgi:hypothetical protein